MIRALTVSNYRSLGENVRVQFDRFTVLVGPNGSGKSNVMDALRFVSDTVTLGLSGAITARHGIDAVRRWSGGHPFNVAIRVDLALDDGPAFYEFELAGSSGSEYEVKSEVADVVRGDSRVRFRAERGQWIESPEGLRPPVDRRSLALQLVGGDQRFQPLVHALQHIAVYAIFPDTLRVPQQYTAVRPMSRHGDNWVSILRDCARGELEGRPRRGPASSHGRHEGHPRDARGELPRRPVRALRPRTRNPSGSTRRRSPTAPCGSLGSSPRCCRNPPSR